MISLQSTLFQTKMAQVYARFMKDNNQLVVDILMELEDQTLICHQLTWKNKLIEKMMYV